MERQSKLDAVVEELRAERELWEGRVADLQEKLKEVSANLHRVEAALAALEPKAGKKPGAKGAPQNGRGFTASEVVLVIEAALKRESPLREEVIGKRVGEEATRRGKVKSGLHLIVRKVLAEEDRFVGSEQGWRLVEARPASG